LKNLNNCQCKKVLQNIASSSETNLKKMLTTFVVVALFLSVFSTLPKTSVRADTSEAEVLSYSWYVAPANTVLAQYTGDLITVGEVQNVGTNVISYVIVTGVAYDANGVMLAATSVPAYGNNMLSGQKAPFYLDFTPEKSVTQNQSWVSSVSNVEVMESNVVDTNEAQYSGLTIATGGLASYIDSSGTYTVTGTIQNSGSQKTGNVWVVATFYDAAGTVVALNYTTYLSASLAPGDLVRFTVTPTDNIEQLSSKIANYSVLIQSDTSSSSSSSSPTASSSPNNSQRPNQPIALPSWLTYVAVIVVMVVAVVVTLLLLFRKRRRRT
jgi:hypothetical protein